MAANQCQQLTDNIKSIDQELAEWAAGNISLTPVQVQTLKNSRAEYEALMNTYGCSVHPWGPASTAHTALASSGNRTVLAATDGSNWVYYTWWDLGGGSVGWYYIPNAPLSQEAPSVALTGNDHSYLFIYVRDSETGVSKGTQLPLGATGFNPWVDLS